MSATFSAIRVRGKYILLAAALAACLATTALHAEVVVLSNRTTEPVRFELSAPGGEARQYELASREVTPYPVLGDVHVAFDAGGRRRRYLLQGDTVFAFDVRDGKLDLLSYPIAPTSEETQAAETARRALPPEREAKRHTVGALPVMILVDDDEPAVRRLWEARLRKRVAAASAVFERTCRLRLEVVAVGTWESDDSVHDFKESFGEFERKAVPGAARVAIGFTSQYEVVRGRTHLGGTRGPLYSHILIREWSHRVTEAQRLEVLVHELGHYLGAVHSPDPNSVMRPVLIDRRSNARQFRIGFDPVNTFVLYKVGEELRTRGIRHFAQMSPRAKARLRAAYKAMDKALPNDTSGAAYAALLDRPLVALAGPVEVSEPAVAATRSVLRAIAVAAQEPDRPPDGDRLTDYYVRVAAHRAGKFPKEVSGRAFLLSLALGLDDSSVLRGAPVFGAFCRKVETDDEREHRQRVLGRPTMLGRRDLAQHFFVSCGLAELAGPGPAEAAGLLKEILDARGGSGFSFVDLSADLSGVALARGIRDGSLELSGLAKSFTVADYLPPRGDLKEGISLKDLQRDYGGPDDERFRRVVKTIRERIGALTPYASAKRK